MPRRDGTGPVGYGAGTGRGLGPCTGRNLIGLASGAGMVAGLGYCLGGRRFGRRNVAGILSEEDYNQAITLEKEALERRLEEINKMMSK